MVFSKLQTLVDTAFNSFEAQYNEAKTWFCGMYLGFELHWSEAVLHYVQNWVTQAEATETYLCTIGTREIPILLKALDEQRCELLIQEHARKRLAYWNQTLGHTIVKLSTLVTLGTGDKQTVKEAYELIQKVVDESSQ